MEDWVAMVGRDVVGFELCERCVVGCFLAPAGRIETRMSLLLVDEEKKN